MMNKLKDLFVIVHPDGSYLSVPFEKDFKIEWSQDILEASTMPGIVASFTAMKIEPTPTVQSLADAMNHRFRGNVK